VSWLRTGDNAAVNPIVLRASLLLRRRNETVMEREVIKCELFGFVSLCATLSTAFDQDYVVGEETAFSVAGQRTDRLLKLAVQSGYMVKHVGGYKIVDDPKFLHMVLKSEKEWMAQQSKDNSNIKLTVPVRLRDGDSCRYCRVIVSFADKYGRGGTYDHRTPGQEARTPDDLVVSCRACNSSRGNDPEADSRVPLLAPPAVPYYSALTAAYLLKNGGITVTPSDTLRPGMTPDPATPSDPDPEATSTRTPPKRATRTPKPLRPGPRTHQLDHSAAATPAKPAKTDTGDSGITGTGRDGTGSQVVPNPSVTRAKRARRGKGRTIPPQRTEGQQP